jgi:serine protease inhibitor
LAKTDSKVELPYSNPDLSLIFVLPGRVNEFALGALAKFEEKLTSSNLVSMMKSMTSLPVDLKVPVFLHRAAVDLNEVKFRFLISKHKIEGRGKKRELTLV